ncbi:HPr family phosphocarrier protein [Candidatus Schneideria nysicola]|uniref:HPr family phosphocarrier protein n=1 Tax=Candidatus Schneideria nysicola TaxID=1081631 RepID=UPI001CAA567E|nr:HPr family phosphocarrier protein [Candidatus Schneideria nysicola]UAJ66059.1 HPr family phosphocarrier protein [Candidatus Schneideria nysicola]
MYEKKVKLIVPHGLHLRPTAEFVKAAKKFRSNITITSSNNKCVDAKSLFKLQTLGLTYGSIMTITAEGEDEKEAVEYLTQLIDNLK